MKNELTEEEEESENPKFAHLNDFYCAITPF